MRTNTLLQTPIGKVDEVLGPINQVYFTIKPQEGIVATSFKPGDKVYIGGDKLLPLEKYGSFLYVYFANSIDLMIIGSFLSLSHHRVGYHLRPNICCAYY